MKKSGINYLYLVIISLAFTVQTCYIDFRETVYGNGNVVTEERLVNSFEGIKVSSGIDVFITQGEEESLEVIADENLIEYILTDVTGGILTIHSDVNIRNARSKEVHLIYKKLRSIKISSAGDLKGMNRMNAQDLEIRLSSAGDLNLDLAADQVHCSITSSGDARLSGIANELVADLSSAGDLYAYDLIVKKARIHVSSAGNARIHATEEVNLSASSAGDIYYMGNPQTIHTSTSSAGSIRKK